MLKKNIQVNTHIYFSTSTGQLNPRGADFQTPAGRFTPTSYATTSCYSQMIKTIHSSVHHVEDGDLVYFPSGRIVHMEPEFQ